MRVGFVGWRGMVGSVLRSRMESEGDLDGIELSYGSTSNPGSLGPDGAPLFDANAIDSLAAMDTIVTCQGGDYTSRVHSALRQAGWSGFWVDAASTLRMQPTTTLVLDPVNGAAIEAAIRSGCRDFVGPNCTVSLLLLALNGLIQRGCVEWISTMSYQAASGAGAANMRELVQQMAFLGHETVVDGDTPLALDDRIASRLREADFPNQHFGVPLAASAIPWIDRLVDDGQTREEWKAMAEANKLLGRASRPLPIDGICVRIGSMRSHAQAVTVKLNAAIPLDEVEGMIRDSHEWTDVVPNRKDETLQRLTPAAVAGTLQVPVGRLRTLKMGPEYLTAFTVGDQLLWGAAEPLRRVLLMIRDSGA